MISTTEAQDAAQPPVLDAKRAVHASLLADLEKRFREKPNVEDSWFVLSLPKDSSDEIEMFLAEEDLPIDEEEEKPTPEKTTRKEVDIDMGPEFETQVLDNSLTVFDSYPLHVDEQIAAEEGEEG